MKNIVILFSVLFLLSCGENGNEVVHGGHQPPQEGQVFGKPASDYYKRFKYTKRQVDLKWHYWYLQSLPEIFANSPNRAWSIDVQLNFNPRPTYVVRYQQWVKSEEEWVAVSDSPAIQGDWKIENRFLKMSTIATMAPYETETTQAVMLLLGKGFIEPALAGKKVQVDFLETRRPF